MPKPRLTADDLGKLFFLLAILLGAWFRLYLPLNAGFPIGDGGLFAAMIQALQQNDYRLPEFVQYNGLNIPFAYPPLGFYIAGWVTKIFHITILQSLMWIPAFVLVVSIPAVYKLALLVLKSHFKAGLAALFYALLPGSIAWLIMGGGITRSFGQLFLILTTACVYLLFTTRQPKYIPVSILCSTLVCLSHPEAAIHTLAIVVILWLLYGRNKAGIFSALYVAAGTLLLTSPWWLIILSRFGLTPYLSASQTGLSQAVILLAPFVSFSQETFLPILATLAILGIAVSIARKDYLLPIVYIAPFLVEARDATNVYIITLALLAALAFSDMVLPTLSKMAAAGGATEYALPLQSHAEQLLLAYLLLCLILGMQVADGQYLARQISTDLQTAFEWIKANTPPESRFVVLAGKTTQLNDFANEWFPLLAERRSVTTVQGLEWLGRGIFAQHEAIVSRLQACQTSASIAECIEQNSNYPDFQYDYILLTADATQPELGGLDIAKGYKTIYSSKTVLIIQKIR